MECKNCNFLLGLGVGAVVGALVYHFSCSSKAQKMKHDVCHAFHKIGHEAENMINTAKDEVVEVGAKVVNKIADSTDKVAEKADDMKDKANAYATSLKK